MIRNILLKRDERGSAAVEFAIAVPVLVSFIWGIFQVGLLLQANAGMQHALGEGSRFATLYVEDNADRRPTDDEIQARIQETIFKPSVGSFSVDAPTTGAGFKTLTVRYNMPMDFLFFPGPTVSIVKSKRVYVVTGTSATPPSCSTPGGGGSTCTSTL